MTETIDTVSDKEIKARMRQIKRTIGGIARAASFMSEKQLAPYEAMAKEYDELKAELELRRKTRSKL